jgi:hypothetical protein
MGIIIGMLISAAALAPFTLMLVPNPKPVRVGAPALQLPGTYVCTGGDVYHVFQYSRQPDGFPESSLIASADAVPVVRYKGLDDLAIYALTRYPSGAMVAVSKRVDTHARMIELRPTQPLTPGRYAVRMSSEDAFSGPEFAFFSVETSTASQ